MSKPFNEFGGWLSFCKVCIILSFIMVMIDLVLASIALIANPFMHVTNINTQDTVSAVIGILGSVVFVLIQIQMLKILKTRAPIIPSQISKLFIVWLVVLITIWGVFFVMDHFTILPGSFNDKSKISIVAGSIIPLSCLAYFRWSKRVKAYYGVNAFE